MRLNAGVVLSALAALLFALSALFADDGSSRLLALTAAILFAAVAALRARGPAQLNRAHVIKNRRLIPAGLVCLMAIILGVVTDQPGVRISSAIAAICFAIVAIAAARQDKNR